MAVETLSEKYLLPKKLGRIEVQQSALDVNIFGMLMAECDRIAMQGTTRKLVYAGHRYERVQDGAGTWHYNLYAYYDPIDAEEELNPHNLNDAAHATLGQVLTESSLGDIGSKEQRF